MSIYDQQLDRHAANFVPLSPVSFVERSAEVFGDLPAVIHGARRYTWAQLRERSARLAAALRAVGVGRGSTVSVMLPNTPEMVEAHYAVPALNAVLNTLNTRLDAAAAGLADEPLRGAGADHRPRIRAGDGRGVAPAARPSMAANSSSSTLPTANTPAPANASASTSTKRCWPRTRRWRAWRARPTNGTPSP